MQREIRPVKQVRLGLEIHDDAGLEGLETIDAVEHVELQVDVAAVVDCFDIDRGVRLAPAGGGARNDRVAGLEVVGPSWKGVVREAQVIRGCAVGREVRGSKRAL